MFDGKMYRSFLKIMLAILAVLVVLLYVYLQQNVAGKLKINEISFAAEDGVDWVEIYNPTMNNWSLKGMYISDKSDKINKYQIEQEVVVPSKGWAVLYGEGYQGEANEQVAVLNFRIANGETIYLVDKDGTSVIDSLTVVAEDGQSGVSIGRFPDGGKDLFVMSQPTLGMANQKDNLLNI